MAEVDFASIADTKQAIFKPFEWKKVDPSKCVEVLENFKSITLGAIKTLEIIEDNFLLKENGDAPLLSSNAEGALIRFVISSLKMLYNTHPDA